VTQAAFRVESPAGHDRAAFSGGGCRRHFPDGFTVGLNMHKGRQQTKRLEKLL
jgi:hypothetical protein